MSFMQQLVKKGRNILGKKNKKYQSQYWKDVGDIPFFLKGDIVETPKGKRARVTGQKGDVVDCYIFDDFALQTFDSDKLKLIDAVDGWKGDKIKKGSEYTANKYHGVQAKFHKPCNHWMDEFKLLDDWKIYLSAKGTPSPKRTGLTPTMGCYMDSGWMLGNTFWFTPNAPINPDLFDTEEIPTLYVKWQDMHAIGLKEYSQTIVWCLSRIFEGERLEIGCHGAHGRTGTLLAGILVYQGMTAEDAINEVHKQHCEKAIETNPQTELIKRYAKELDKQNGTDEEDTTDRSEASNVKNAEREREIDEGDSDILLTSTEGMGEHAPSDGSTSTNS